MDVGTDDVVLTISADVNDAGGSPSRIVLQDVTRGRRSDEDNVIRGTVGISSVERDGDQAIPSNPPHLDQQEAVTERSTEQPLAVPNDHVEGDAPDPVQSDRSERECQWPGDTLKLSALNFSSCLNG